MMSFFRQHEDNYMVLGATGHFLARAYLDAGENEGWVVSCYSQHGPSRRLVVELTVMT